MTAVLLTALILAVSCSGSSPSPEVETFFLDIETAFQTYDLRKQEITDEFNSHLPQVESTEDLEAIRREGLRAVLIAHGDFESSLNDVKAVVGLTDEHGVLLQLIRTVGEKYAEELELRERGSADQIEPSEDQMETARAVGALLAQCRTLQRVADDRGVDVHLVCSPQERER